MESTQQALFRECIREALPPEDYQAWIDSLALQSVSSSKVVISGIPHELYIFDIRANHESLFLKILKQLFPEHAPFQSSCMEYWVGDSAPKSHAFSQSSASKVEENASVETKPPLQTSFLFPESNSEAQKAPAPQKAPKKKATASGRVPENKKVLLEKPATMEFRSSLADLVIGKENEFLFKAAHAVVEMPGLAFNPFVVHGSLGTGKTHLLEGIGKTLQQNHPESKIIYVKGEQFLNDFMQHIEKRSMNTFRAHYRSADVLLFDDLHVLSRAKKCQIECYHTLETLHKSGKQMVLTSEYPVSKTKDLNHSLASLLQSGLELEFEHPELQTRIHILEHKAKTMNYVISDMEKEYIATHIPQNVGKMLGALTRLAAHSSLMNQELTANLVQQLLENLTHSSSDSSPSLQPTLPHTAEDTILERVCGMFQVSTAELVSDRRGGRFLEARKIYTYLLRELTCLTLVEIGKRVGRNHSTVVNTLNKMRVQMKNDIFFQKQILALKQELYGSSQLKLPLQEQSFSSRSRL